MNNFELASAVTGISVYIPLCINLLRKRVVQNMATYLLWLVLDGVTALAIWSDRGNFFLPAVYALGSICVCLCILRARTFEWTQFETWVATMTVACMVIWKLTDAEWATISGTTAVMIASIPLIRDAYRKPHEQPFLTFCGFVVSNGFGIVAGDAWTIQERFYSTTCFGLTVGVVMMILIRKRLVPHPQPA